MSTVLHPAKYDAQFGITEQHWPALAAYAAHHRLYIFIRGGKRASIPWIEFGFPGKPMQLKFGVDASKGLLVARAPAERQQVFDAGHLLLTKTTQGWRAAGPDARITLPVSHPVSDRWAEEGIVVDRATLLPFTSDYDLSAVIPSGDFDYVRDMAGFMLGASVTSSWAEQVRNELNAIFGSLRFRHGPQAMYDQKLANRAEDAERIVAFCANGAAYWFLAALTPESAMVQYRDLVLALHPQARPQFTN